MKIIVTGSLGPISRPLTQLLVQQGQSVTVISSNASKQKAIEDLGANAAIGSLKDVAFLTNIFTGSDAIYLMEPTVNFSDTTIDIYEHYRQFARVYVQAIRQSCVKRIVHLSSIGGHTENGNGMLKFHHYVEQILKELPAEVAITTLRPVSFYSNILAFVPMAKSQNAIITDYKSLHKEPWASPLDIADVIAEEIVKPFEGRRVRYIASDEVTSDELVVALSEAIGKPDLKWVTVPAEVLQKRFIELGMNPQGVEGS
ncbi:NmrA family NAD(P)-binding protein [Bacteroides reticulotermitis]|uniref:NmrA-like domain-containing protein n=1 Tax=Bacteroides reticulotermitis JCM 10512 TaxID=1445607 RepID=W4UVW1_9BACE|nr:NAD(P)H-binding protein [Bacteroides reticulotermitis]GAE84942.1 hypothetical protein JCM10512_3325 [Bacteroides reticulotermitis JCM 10512]